MNRTGQQGRRGRCKSCHNADVRSRADRYDQRAYDLRRNYDLTVEAYDELFLKQEGRCAICGGVEPNSRTRNLHVDHDHGTGKVRGLLCGPCNVGIGNLRDDPKIVEAALQYLRK